MSPIGVILIIVGALFIYEEVKGGIGTAQAATKPPQSDLGVGHTAAPSDSFTTGTIPTAWINAIFRHESPNYTPGSTAFGLSDPTGRVTAGPSEYGSNVFRSLSRGADCQPCPDGYPCCTPPMQLFASATDAMNAFARTVESPIYADARAYLAANPNDCRGFMVRFGAHYLGPGDVQQWADNICSLAGQ